MNKKIPTIICYFILTTYTMKQKISMFQNTTPNQKKDFAKLQDPLSKKNHLEELSFGKAFNFQNVKKPSKNDKLQNLILSKYSNKNQTTNSQKDSEIDQNSIYQGSEEPVKRIQESINHQDLDKSLGSSSEEDIQKPLIKETITFQEPSIELPSSGESNSQDNLQQKIKHKNVTKDFQSSEESQNLIHIEDQINHRNVSKDFSSDEENSQEKKKQIIQMINKKSQHSSQDSIQTNQQKDIITPINQKPQNQNSKEKDITNPIIVQNTSEALSSEHNSLEQTSIINKKRNSLKDFSEDNVISQSQSVSSSNENPSANVMNQKLITKQNSQSKISSSQKSVSQTSSTQQHLSNEENSLQNTIDNPSNKKKSLISSSEERPEIINNQVKVQTPQSSEQSLEETINYQNVSDEEELTKRDILKKNQEKLKDLSTRDDNLDTSTNNLPKDTNKNFSINLLPTKKPSVSESSQSLKQNTNSQNSQSNSQEEGVLNQNILDNGIPKKKPSLSQSDERINNLSQEEPNQKIKPNSSHERISDDSIDGINVQKQIQNTPKQQKSLSHDNEQRSIQSQSRERSNSSEEVVQANNNLTKQTKVTDKKDMKSILSQGKRIGESPLVIFENQDFYDGKIKQKIRKIYVIEILECEDCNQNNYLISSQNEL